MSTQRKSFQMLTINQIHQLHSLLLSSESNSIESYRAPFVVITVASFVAINTTVVVAVLVITAAFTTVAIGSPYHLLAALSL